MEKFNLFTEKLDDYFSRCIESNKFNSDGKIEQTFKEIILPHALTEDSKLSFNGDKFFVEIYEDKDGVILKDVYTSKNITNEEYLLYQFRLTISFKVIEDGWVKEDDGSLKRIIKKLKIYDIYLHDKEQLNEILNTIDKNNLIGNRYSKEMIKIIKNYIK